MRGKWIVNYMLKFPSYVKYKLRIAKRPYFLDIILTENCNGRCVMCNYWKKKSNEEITPGEIREFLRHDLMKGLKTIAITGGEIFMRKDISEVIDIVYKEKEIRPILGTNGLFPKLLNSLLKEKKHKIAGVMVSVDGVGEVHDRVRGKGTFDITMKSLEIIRKHGFRPTINMTLSSLNYDKLLDTYNHFKKDYDFTYKIANRSAEHFGNNLNSKIFLTDEMIRNVLRDAEKIKDKNLYDVFLDEWALYGKRPDPCYAGITSIVLGAHGEIQPCINKPSIGSIRKKPLEKIWPSERAERFRKQHKHCQDCYDRCTTADSFGIDLPKYVIKKKIKELRSKNG